MKALVLLWAAAAASAQCTADRPDILGKLIDAKVVDQDRILVHCDHVCDLRFAEAAYPVVDIVELVKNASVPRGVQRIVIFDSRWRPVKTIPYLNERPWFCSKNEIFVRGKLRTPDSTGDAGNVIVFRGPELPVEFRNVDPLKFPALRETQQSR